MGKFSQWRCQTRAIDGNEVINVSSCQTEGFRDGTRTSSGEKDHSCAFVIMQQQVSEQGSAIRAHGDTNTLLENTIANLTVHLVEEKGEHFVISWGVKRSMLRLLVLVQWARRFLSILIYFLLRPSKLSPTNLGMHSVNSVCGKFV